MRPVRSNICCAHFIHSMPPQAENRNGKCVPGRSIRSFGGIATAMSKVEEINIKHIYKIYIDFPSAASAQDARCFVHSHRSTHKLQMQTCFPFHWSDRINSNQNKRLSTERRTRCRPIGCKTARVDRFDDDAMTNSRTVNRRHISNGEMQTRFATRKSSIVC